MLLYILIVIDMGDVYITDAVDHNRVKIGYWTSSFKRLFDRYRTTLGSDLKIHMYRCEHPQLLEKVVHTHFFDHRITGELFKREYIEEYKAFLETHKTCTLAELNEIMIKTPTKKMTKAKQIREVKNMAPGDKQIDDSKKKKYKLLTHPTYLEMFGNDENATDQWKSLLTERSKHHFYEFIPSAICQLHESTSNKHGLITLLSQRIYDEGFVHKILIENITKICTMLGIKNCIDDTTIICRTSCIEHELSALVKNSLILMNKYEDSVNDENKWQQYKFVSEKTSVLFNHFCGMRLTRIERRGANKQNIKMKLVCSDDQLSEIYKFFFAKLNDGNIQNPMLRASINIASSACGSQTQCDKICKIVPVLLTSTLFQTFCNAMTQSKSNESNVYKACVEHVNMDMVRNITRICELLGLNSCTDTTTLIHRKNMTGTFVEISNLVKHSLITLKMYNLVEQDKAKWNIYKFVSKKLGALFNHWCGMKIVLVSRKGQNKEDSFVKLVCDNETLSNLLSLYVDA